LWAGKLLDVSVLDHLIIGGSSFVSLNRRGLGFEGEQQFCLDCQKESNDSNKVEDKEKRVVAMSKPLPKLVHDLARIHPDESGKVQLVIDKHGTIVATTLGKKVPEKEPKK
jgi:hypothetical protein